MAPFYMGVRDKTELIQVINRYADDIRTGLSMSGTPQLADAIIGEIRDGRLEETTLPVGQTFQFMLFRHTISGRDRETGRQFSRGEVDVIRNLYWAGTQPIQAYVLRVEDQQNRYTFAIPFGRRGCSNLALIERRPFPVCVLRVTRAEGGQGNCWTIDASASYSTEDIVSVQVTVSDASGNVLVTQDGRTAFQWCCPSPSGTFTVRTVVTNREGITRECTETINCGVIENPNQPPRCVLVVSPEDVLSGQTVTIDATGASDAENCIRSNIVEIRDGDGNVLLSANGNEVIFFKFRKGGTYTIVNTVTDCQGATTVCEKTVNVTRKRFHFLVSLGGLYEKRVGFDTVEGLFDIALIVQTDPWPDRQFIRATIQTLSTPPGTGAITYRIQTFRNGALVDDSNTATRELMMQEAGSYRIVATATANSDAGQVSDMEEVAFTIARDTNQTFGPENDNDDEVNFDVDGDDTNWYIPIKLGFAYELVSNIEAALYGGVAISVDELDDSALFGDLELNYRGDPIMFGIGLGWWNFNHDEIDTIDLLVNAGVIFAKSLFGSDTWTFVVQGRFPLNSEGDTSFGDEYRIFFGIRLDF